MNKNLLAIVAAALLAGPMAAQAIPVTYDIVFGGNAEDADGGTGSFIWDDTTRTLSNIVWDFGAGSIGSGGINDSLVNWSQPFSGGGTIADLTAEILTGDDLSPANCVADGCLSVWVPPQLFGGLSMMRFRITNGFQNYTVGLGQVGGGFSSSVRATSVPEPGTLALFGLGLAALGFARRRRAAN